MVQRGIILFHGVLVCRTFHILIPSRASRGVALRTMAFPQFGIAAAFHWIRRCYPRCGLLFFFLSVGADGFIGDHAVTASTTGPRSGVPLFALVQRGSRAVA